MNNEIMCRNILALDQGTTSSRAIIFNEHGQEIISARMDFSQYMPRESWVEHDANEIWESQLTVARKVLADSGLEKSSIATIGITNQRETIILWEAGSGAPIGRAIVWQCRRSSDICHTLKEQGYEEIVHKKTGLKLDPYFSGTKIKWKFDDTPGLMERAEHGEILFGTVDSWLVWNLTGGRVHAIDVTNASRTMLMNLKTGEWDEEMLEMLDIPRRILPEIRPSIGFFGETDPSIFGIPIPITGIAGDQHAALFGHRAFNAGDVKNTYGTGCFMLMNVGDRPVYSEGGLLSTVAWGDMDGKLCYALEGSVFMAGALLLWLKDNLGIVNSVEEISRHAHEVEENGGVYLVPAYQGLGTPWWDSRVRGTLSGLTRASTKLHVCRAYLESIAYRSKDVIDVMIAESKCTLTQLNVDGGVSNSDFLMKFQADILGIPVSRPSFVEVTALGVALMAGLGAGLWKNLEEIPKAGDCETLFHPEMSQRESDRLYNGWLDIVRRNIQH